MEHPPGTSLYPFLFCSAVAIPIPHTENKRENSGTEVTASMRTFPLITAVATHEIYFFLFLSDIFAALIHPYSRYIFAAWHFLLEAHEYTKTHQRTDSTAKFFFPSCAQTDVLQDRMKSCTPEHVPGCRQLQECSLQKFTALSKKIVKLKVKNKRSSSSACSQRQSLSFSSVCSIQAFINTEVIFGLSSLTPSC